MKNEQTVPYNLRLPKKLKTRLEKQAKDEKRSLNQQLIVMLERSVDSERKKEAVAV